MQSIKTELRWALIFAATLLGWMLLERVEGLHDRHIDKHMVLTNLFAIPAIIIYVLALRDKKHRVLGGSLTYLQALNCGAIISVFVAVMSPGLQWVISTVITPRLFCQRDRVFIGNRLL